MGRLAYDRRYVDLEVFYHAVEAEKRRLNAENSSFWENQEDLYSVLWRKLGG